jgi:hypothetical protein
MPNSSTRTAAARGVWLRKRQRANSPNNWSKFMVIQELTELGTGETGR